jgi:hypothetical protein
MNPAFVQAIADLNTATLDMLGNVTVTLAGVTDLSALFVKSFYASNIGDSGIASTQASLTLQTFDVPPKIIDWFAYFAEPFNPIDLLVTVAGGNYKIVAHEPNGTGLSRLILEVA